LIPFFSALESISTTITAVIEIGIRFL